MAAGDDYESGAEVGGKILLPFPAWAHYARRAKCRRVELSASPPVRLAPSSSCLKEPGTRSQIGVKGLL